MFDFVGLLQAGLDDGLDSLDDEDYGEENNYDALNDETFGAEASADDWEQNHEKLARITESSRPRLRNESGKVGGTRSSVSFLLTVRLPVICIREYVIVLMGVVLWDGQSESEIDVETTLSHLVLDEKEVTIPRPGVWDSPGNFQLQPPQIRPKPSLSTALKNACTVEELERGLITSRPPPGLVKQQQQQPQNLFLNSIGSSVDKLGQINGVGQHQQHQQPPPNQFPLVLPPNIRLTHPQFHLQNVRPMPSEYRICWWEWWFALLLDF